MTRAVKGPTGTQTHTIPDQTATVAELRAYLDAQGIPYPSTALKADLLALVNP